MRFYSEIYRDLHIASDEDQQIGSINFTCRLLISELI